jgi:predicted dehydrogenase
MKKNILVAGCGHWGKNLVRNFAAIGALKYISDPNKKLAQSMADQYQIEHIPYDQAIKSNEVEGVVIAAPAQFHAEMSISAMKLGKHVYVEKPLAMTQQEAEDMIQISKKYNVKLMVGHLLQYHPIFEKMKSIIHKGELGKLDYLYSNRLSFGKIRSEEDVIWSFAPHDISMILSLTKELPHKIRTDSSSILQKGISDLATIHLDFKNGLKAHVFVSWLNPYKEQKIIAICKKGMLVFDDTMQWDKKLSLYKHIIELDDGMPSTIKADPVFINVEEDEPLKRECKYFIDLIDGNVKDRTDGTEGLRVLKVLTSASESIVKKSEVKIEL